MGIKRMRRCAALALALFLFVIPFAPQIAQANSASATPTPKPTVIKSRPVASPDPYPSNPANLKTSSLFAQSAILIDGNTSEVLFEKDSDKRLMPASITKMMTCLLAIENCDLDEIVTVDPASNKCEATYLPVKAGEHIVLRDLLTGMMLKSANDAAIAVACHVAGTEKDFLQMMNDRAQAIGCTSTVYKSVNGLTIAGHVTTAADQAKIAQECMKNSTFREIVSTLEITIPANDVYTEERPITNANKFLPGLGDTQYGYEYAIGVKTGYTDAAQSTFVGAAVKDGVYLISVVLGSTKGGKWTDTTALMDYGFTRYQEADIANLYALNPLTVNLENVADSDPSQGVLTLKLIVPPDVQNDPIRMTGAGMEALADDFQSKLYIQYLRELRAPITENEPVARMTLQIGDAIFTGNLVASTAVEGNEMPVVGSDGTALPTATQLIDGINGSSTPSLAQRFWWIFLLPAIALILIITGCVMEIRHRKRRRTRVTHARYAGGSYASMRRR